MNIECTLSLLRREGILLDHAPHSAQFRNLTTCLLGAFSAAGAIPALSAQDARLYSTLAPLHDVGKRAIPSEILNKPGRLTREEFEVMKTRAVNSWSVFRRSKGTKHFR